MKVAPLRRNVGQSQPAVYLTPASLEIVIYLSPHPRGLDALIPSLYKKWHLMS
jgi:hypothetical protein